MDFVFALLNGKIWQVRITNLICLPFTFCFNTDSGVLPGTAESLRDYMLPWKIASDTMPFVRVGSTSKTLTCLANLACDATQSNGLTELTMEGHDLSPKLKDFEHHYFFCFASHWDAMIFEHQHFIS